MYSWETESSAVYSEEVKYSWHTDNNMTSNSEAVRRSLLWPSPSSSQMIEPAYRDYYVPQHSTSYGQGQALTQSRPLSAPTYNNGLVTNSSKFNTVSIPNPYRSNDLLISEPSPSYTTRRVPSAPYAPRLCERSIPPGYSKPGGFLPYYNALCDPYLREYFEKKFACMPRPPSVTRSSTASSRAKKKKAGKKRRRGSLDDQQRHHEAVYKVTVTTGDKKNAATDAKVFITIRGSRGKLVKRRLSKKVGSTSTKRKAPFKFNRGTSHTFKLLDRDVGDISSIVIEHDGLTEEQGWYLEQVEIVKRVVKTDRVKSWVFDCQEWLSLFKGDGRVERELFAKANYSKTEYEIVTVTGDCRGAGTDANVFVTLFGTSGQTPKLPLRAKSGNPFERNKIDVFELSTNYVGPFTKLRIEHDNTGQSPGWFLDKVTITDLKNPKLKYHFPCGQWLARNEGDGQICRDLVGHKDQHGSKKANQYKVKIYTGKKRGAGTDANVYMTIFGANGDSGERKLDTAKNNFESGQVDEFTIDSPGLGAIKRIRIGHDNSGPSPGWYLERVVITDQATRAEYEFPCNRWLARDEDDGMIARDLLCAKGASGSPGIPYTIHVKTGDVTNAGTSARVFVVLQGGRDGERTSGKLYLEKGHFRRNGTDVFNVEVADNLSPLSSIQIGHDNSGSGPGWYLDRVMVNNPTAGMEQWFICDGWLALDEGDRTIERTLYETEGLRKERKGLVPWIVDVYTSDKRGAGTDAHVILVAYGKTRDGDSVKSDEIELKNSGVTFERGQKDQFKIEMDDIGKPYKIRIRHDNTKAFAAWHLDKVEMENTLTKKRYVFKCDRWLAENEDDGATVREIPAEGDDIRKPEPMVHYQVQVHTGSVRGAGTDANVFLNVFGEQGDTGERPLKKSKTNRNKFESGKVDEFDVEAVTLKKIKRIRIGHDGTKAGDGWFLDKVVVKQADDPSTETVFECKRWLDVKEDDGLIVREITAGGSQMLSTTSYQVSVKTGDVSHAGTDANVSVKIFGTKGDTGELVLRSSDNTKNKFERGRTDLFKLEAANIGKIEKIRIGHDGSSPGAGWFLDEVNVNVPSRGENYIFACHRWLDKREGDGQIEIELEPSRVEKATPKIPFEVTVWTGNKRGAGTDADVFLQMYGVDGKTEECMLRNRSDNFEKGQVDKFKIEADDVGPLLKIRVGHNGKGLASGWFLEKILIQRHAIKGTRKRRRLVRTHSKMAVISRSNVDNESSEEDLRNGSRKGRRHDDGGYDSYSDNDDDDRRSTSRNGRNRPASVGRNSRADSRKESRTDRKETRKDRRNGHHSNDDDDDEVFGRRKSNGHKATANGHGSRHSDDSEDNLDRRKMSKRRDDREDRRDDRREGRHDRRDSRKDSRGRRSDEDDERASLSSSPRGRASSASSRRENERKEREAERKNGRKSSVSSPRSKRRDHRDDSDDERPSSPRRPGSRPSSAHSGRGRDRKHDSDDERDHSRSRRKNSRKKDEGEDEEEIEEYWFFSNRWFSTDEDDHKIVRELLPTDENGKALDNGLQEIQYVVTVKTGPKTGSGTDANVFMNMTGEFGDTGERKLTDSNHRNKFETNQEDVFKVDAVELGRLKKLKIRHDNKGGGAAWFLDYVEVEDPKNQKTYFFPCQRWLSTKDDDGQISRDLVPVDISLKAKFLEKGITAIRDEVALETKAAMTTYHVFVYTGDKKGAGTDANVYVILFGEKDDTGMKPLKTSKTNNNKFERKQMDEFIIEAVDIGELEKIKIGHDNAGGGSDWYLDKVEIDCPSLGQKWLFPCARWLAKGKDDGLIERELIPQKMATELYEKCIPYEIATYTSEARGASTSADVFIVIYGQELCTTQRPLCSSKAQRKASFKDGAVDKFVLELEDVGETIEKIRIGHDNAGMGPGWHLDKVEIRRLKSSGKGSETYVFPCGRWLAKNEEDGVIVRELVPDKVIDESIARDGSIKKKEKARKHTLVPKQYVVNVITGSVRGAGTNANVFLNIYGDKGDTGERKLEKSETNMDKFEKGRTDVFKMEAVDLGKVYKILIRHDNSGLTPDWFLERVEVVDTATNDQYLFHCERWLAKKKDDFKVERVIYVKGYEGDMNSSMGTLKSSARFGGSVASLESTRSSEPFSKSPRLSRRSVSGDIPAGATIPYTVRVTTGPEPDMGTESNVWIKIVGPKNKHTGTQYLELAKKKSFRPGSVEIFSLEAPDVDEVKQIELGHDGVTEGSGWYVKDVDIDMPTKGKHFFFSCNAWLARDKDDSKTRRVFVLNEKEKSMVSFRPMVPYELTVVTGDEANAGCSAQIIMKVFGSGGSSSNIKLDKMSERFERGKSDLMKIELEDIAPLKKLRIGHNGKGERPDWLLDRLELRNLDNGELTVFKANCWLSKTKGDGKLVRDLVAYVKNKPQLKETTYKLHVQTSDVRYAGTDANVYAVICGENGDSGELHLKESETNRSPCHTGQLDVFTFPNLLSLGQPIKLRIWHDNKGIGSAWHLSQIELEDVGASQKYLFPCGKWLSKTDDDKQICRELVCANLKSPATKEKMKYEIEITTSDKQDAGMSQNAWLVLQGEERSSKEFVMENFRNAKDRIFQRGQVDSFTMVSYNLGSLKKCVLGAVGAVDRSRQEAKRRANQWHCYQVAVRNKTTGDRYVFPCNSWIPVSPDLDDRHAKILDVEKVEESLLTTMKTLDLVKYEVSVVTGNVSGAGTDANVFITIFGSHIDSGKRQLTQKMRNCFEKGQTDKFLIEAVDLGELVKIVIEHDNSNLRPGWFVDHVQVTNTGSNQSWTFPCNQWLDMKKGDGEISRELLARN